MSNEKKTSNNNQGHAPLAGVVVRFSQDKIEDFNRRLQLLSEEPEGLPEITAFPEIKLTEEQIEVIAQPMFGFTKDELLEYYRGKIHGEILLTSSHYTTIEDQPDFQYLVDLGVKAMKAGMVL